MRKNFNGVGALIVQLEKELMEQSINFEEFQFKSLAEDLRDNWDGVLEVLKQSKKKTGSKYSILIKMLNEHEYQVSESTLRTTVMRIKREKQKLIKKVKQILPPVVEDVEVTKNTTTDQVAAVELALIVEEQFVGDSEVVQRVELDAQKIYDSYRDTGSIVDDFTITDDFIRDLDWDSEITRIQNRERVTDRAWTGWDKRLFNVFLWFAVKHRCTISVVSVNVYDFFFDEKKTECFKLFVQKAETRNINLEVPSEF